MPRRLYNEADRRFALAAWDAGLKIGEIAAALDRSYCATHRYLYTLYASGDRPLTRRSMGYLDQWEDC